MISSHTARLFALQMYSGDKCSRTLEVCAVAYCIISMILMNLESS